MNPWGTFLVSVYQVLKQKGIFKGCLDNYGFFASEECFFQESYLIVKPFLSSFRESLSLLYNSVQNHHRWGQLGGEEPLNVP